MHGGGWMRFLRIAGAIAILFLVAPPASAAPKTVAVSIPGNYFYPQTIRVHIGDTVRWTNTSNSNHSVISNSNSAEVFKSSTNCHSGVNLFNDCIRPGESYSHTFDHRGSFTYHDANSGTDNPFPNCGMCGRVVVLRKSSPTTSPTAQGSPTGSGSPTSSLTPSPSGSASPGGPQPDSSARAGGPDGSSGGTPTIAIAAAGVALLGGAGFVVYRTMIRRG